jgi:hypothetical protein
LTKDLIPVIYHDFLVSETGIDAPVHTLTLEQVSVDLLLLRFPPIDSIPVLTAERTKHTQTFTSRITRHERQEEG